MLQTPIATAQNTQPDPEECATIPTSAQPSVGYVASKADQEFIAANVEDGSILHQAGLNELNIEETTAVDSEDGGVFYRVPIESGFDSDFLLVERKNNEVVKVAESHISQVSESHISQVSDSEARVKVWIDGESVHDEIVHERPQNGFETRGVKDAWSEFNSCLSNAGVPMAIVTAITIACGFLGAFTAGAGVPACMFAAAGGFSATVSFCYGRAMKKL